MTAMNFLTDDKSVIVRNHVMRYAVICLAVARYLIETNKLLYYVLSEKLVCGPGRNITTEERKDTLPVNNCNQRALGNHY